MGLSYKRAWAIQEAGLLFVILVLCLFLTFASDSVNIRGTVVNNFLRVDNIIPNVITPVSWMAIMAIGVTFVIISGGIDISVGSIFGCAALGTCAVLQNLPADCGPGTVLVVAFIAAIGIGAVCGALNGGLIVSLGLHPFIVTLGTMSVLRGLALVSVETKSLPAWGKALPAAFTSGFVSLEWGSGPFAWARLQPVPMLVMVCIVVCAWLLLSRSVEGRRIYALGGNAEAARFSGLPVRSLTFRVYLISGIMAGLAGLLSAGYYGSANTATGEGYELTVIAAAVVGGASLSGGRGSALGAVLGAVVIKLIENGIDIIQKLDLGFVMITVSKEYSKIIIGCAIIAAVAIDRVSDHFRHQHPAGVASLIRGKRS